MALTRWTPSSWGLRRFEPLREMEEISEQMDRLFEEMSGRIGMSALKRSPSSGLRMWMPAVDMIDKKGEILVRADLPGMEKTDIHVSVTDSILTIRGERKSEEEKKEENYYYCESSYGSFVRNITLPVPVDKDKIKAEYKNGILELLLPKSKQSIETAKEIAIQ